MTESNKKILEAEAQEILWAVQTEQSTTEIHQKVKAMEAFLAVLVRYGQ